MTEPATPGIIDRLRARYHWFDHVMRAAGRYDKSKGDFYAAGITYYTIFALFPLLMVAFSGIGFALANRPDVLADIERRIKSVVSGGLGQQLPGGREPGRGAAGRLRAARRRVQAGVVPRLRL